MDVNNSSGKPREPRDLMIRFVGDLGRGKRIK